MKMNLRNRFLIPMLLLIVLGMGTSTLVSYIKAKSALEGEITARLKQIGDSTAVLIDTWIEDQKRNVSNWSRQKMFVTAVKDSFIGKAARKSADAELLRLKRDYKWYEDICITDKNGTLVSASNPKIINMSNKNRTYFKGSMEGKICVSKVLKSKGTGNPVFVISAPIKDKDTVTGVFFGVVDLSSVTDLFVAPIRIGKTGYAYIYDERGLFICHPDKSNILKLDMNDFDFGRKMIAQGNGLIEYEYDGIEKMVVFRAIPETGWTLGATADTAELLEPVKELSYWNLGGGSLCISAGRGCHCIIGTIHRDTHQPDCERPWRRIGAGGFRGRPGILFEPVPGRRGQ